MKAPWHGDGVHTPPTDAHIPRPGKLWLTLKEVGAFYKADESSGRRSKTWNGHHHPRWAYVRFRQLRKAGILIQNVHWRYRTFWGMLDMIVIHRLSALQFFSWKPAYIRAWAQAAQKEQPTPKKGKEKKHENRL